MLDGDMFLWGIFTIRSNTNELGLRSNVIKNFCPLIFHQLVVGWIGKAHGPTSGIGSSCWSRIVKEGLWGIFTICSNTNGLGLRSNAIKDLCPLILHQLVIGWIGKAHGPTSGIRAKVIGSSHWSHIVREGLWGISQSTPIPMGLVYDRML